MEETWTLAQKSFVWGFNVLRFKDYSLVLIRQSTSLLKQSAALCFIYSVILWCFCFVLLKQTQYPISPAFVKHKTPVLWLFNQTHFLFFLKHSNPLRFIKISPLFSLHQLACSESSSWISWFVLTFLLWFILPLTSSSCRVACGVWS